MCYTFTLTSEEGEKLFGFCRRFYLKKKIDLSSTSSSTSSSTDNNDDSDKSSSSSLISSDLPECICILSYL